MLICGLIIYSCILTSASSIIVYHFITVILKHENTCEGVERESVWVCMWGVEGREDRNKSCSVLCEIAICGLTASYDVCDAKADYLSELPLRDESIFV